MNLAEVFTGARVALAILQQRLVLLVCMLLTFALFCWAMWLQTPLGAIIAATWGLIIFLPVLCIRRRSSHDAAQAPPEHSGQSE